LGARNGEVRFTSMSRHRQLDRLRPKGASNGTSLSRHLLGTSASKTFIVGKGKVIGIASASLAGSRRLAPRKAYEAASVPPSS